MIVDQTAKLQGLYRVRRQGMKEKRNENEDRRRPPLKSESFHQFVVEVGIVGQAQAAGCSFQAMVRPKSFNAENIP